MVVLFLIILLVVIPAVIGLCIFSEYLGGNVDAHLAALVSRFFQGSFHPGDYLIYRKSKVSPHPGPRARNIQPAENGDSYYYEVDKFWTLADVLDDGRLLAVTRTGKRVCITPSDARLRKARLVDWVRYHRRFPSV